MTPAIILLTAISGVITILVWRYWPSKDPLDEIREIAEQVTDAVNGLEAFETACANRPQVESLYVELASLVKDHERELDTSGDLIESVSSLIRHTHLTKDFSERSQRLRELHADLVEARARALHEVHHALTEVLPDLREKLSQLPVQSGSIAAGVLTLVGLVWMSGYYSVLGVPFIPLLRDFQDVALVGFGAGLLPLMAFTGMATFTLFHVERTRQTARRPTARADAIATALEVARNLRRPKFWAQHSILCLLTVFIASLAAAAASQERSQLEVALSDKGGLSTMRILGGIGDYLVLSEGDDTRVVTVPKERLECFETARTSRDDKGAAGEFCARPNPAPAPDQNIEVSLVTRGEDWRSYVQRQAQCWVVAPLTPQPLLSPAFVADSSEVMNKPYYEERPQHWPVSEKKCEGKSTEQCAIEGIRGELRGWLDSTIKSGTRGATLHLFGFASGTAKPERNIELSQLRAEFIANGLVKETKELGESCRDLPNKADGKCPIGFQIHAMGEMPKFDWAGTQGDPTEQIVLIAACNNDTL